MTRTTNMTCHAERVGALLYCSHLIQGREKKFVPVDIVLMCYICQKLVLENLQDTIKQFMKFMKSKLRAVIVIVLNYI